jgi:hypothetical protein
MLLFPRYKKILKSKNKQKQNKHQKEQKWKQRQEKRTLKVPFVYREKRPGRLQLEMRDNYAVINEKYAFIFPNHFIAYNESDSYFELRRETSVLVIKQTAAHVRNKKHKVVVSMVTSH